MFISADVVQTSTNTQTWIILVGVVFTALSGIFATWITTKTKKENTTQHGLVGESLDGLTKAVASMHLLLVEVDLWRKGFAGSTMPDAESINSWTERLSTMDRTLRSHIEWAESGGETYQEVTNLVEELQQQVNAMRTSV
jgi:hypothetical protein